MNQPRCHWPKCPHGVRCTQARVEGDGPPTPDPRNAHERDIRSGRDFCMRYFPEAHAQKRCGCYPKSGVLVIRSRPGTNAR